MKPTGNSPHCSRRQLLRPKDSNSARAQSHDAGLVVHLAEQRDVVAGLHDLHVIAVDDRRGDAAAAAQQATLVERSTLGMVEDILVLRQESVNSFD